MASKDRDTTGFSRRLNELMERRRLTVQKAATIAGTGTSKIQAWKSGSLSTDYDALHRLAKALDVSFEYLLTGKSETEAGIDEVFSLSEKVFDGYMKVKIERMIPKKKV